MVRPMISDVTLVGAAHPDHVERLTFDEAKFDFFERLDPSDELDEAVAAYWIELARSRSLAPRVDPDRLGRVAEGDGYWHLADLVNQLNTVEAVVPAVDSQFALWTVHLQRGRTSARLIECVHNDLVRVRFADPVTKQALTNLMLIDDLVVDQAWDVTLELSEGSWKLSERHAVHPDQVATACAGEATR